jgi:hypothetical protein
LKLVTLLRDINDDTDRWALKIELNKRYEKVTEEDGIMRDIVTCTTLFTTNKIRVISM